MKKTILLLIPVVLSACNNNKEDMEQSQKAYNEVRTSNNPGSMYRIAESMRKVGNYDLAVKSYEQALQIDPTLTAAYLGMSQCLRMTGRHDAALQLLKSSPMDVKDPVWYKEIGAVYTAAQKPRECLVYYRKAYDLDSSDVGTLNGLGVCNDLMGQHTEAQKWYNSGIAIAPAQSKLGLSLSLSSRTKEAIPMLEAIAEEPDASPRDRQNLAIAYGLSGDLDRAAKLFSQDLSQEDVRKNLAFLHKLAHTQHLTPKQHTSSDSVKSTFETNLVSEGSAEQTQKEVVVRPAAVMESISKDTHVVVSPLPVADATLQEGTNEPQPVFSEVADKVDVVEAMPTDMTMDKVEPKSAKKKIPEATSKKQTKKVTAKKPEAKSTKADQPSNKAPVKKSDKADSTTKKAVAKKPVTKVDDKMAADKAQ
jgi:Flp pilus assembly protein TadD